VTTPLAEEAADICQAVRRQGRRCRALNPFETADAQLLLHAHGLITNISRTSRWQLTQKGRRILTALLTARQADTEKLLSLAA
jgi:hypothetical protein